MLAIYLPWVILAAWRNPPIFDFTFRSEPGVYRGFLWFYFINEHILRFLNLRYPRDYNTVPRLTFLLLHLVWIFPWCVFLPAALFTSRDEGTVRTKSLRLLVLVWIVFLLTFLSFSTTQEYYSMPCYPAFAILLAGPDNSNEPMGFYRVRSPGRRRSPFRRGGMYHPFHEPWSRCSGRYFNGSDPTSRNLHFVPGPFARFDRCFFCLSSRTARAGRYGFRIGHSGGMVFSAPLAGPFMLGSDDACFFSCSQMGDGGI